MQTLIYRRTLAIANLSTAIQQVGDLYREVSAVTNEIGQELGPEKAHKFPLAMGADAFKRQVIDAIGAAMVGKYGEPNSGTILVTGPLGEIQNTELLTVQADKDHENLGVVNV